MKIPALETLVIVTWEDAHTGDDNWCHPKDLDGSLKAVQSAGWLIRSDPKTITVAASRYAEADGMVADITIIPKTCVIEVVSVKP